MKHLSHDHSLILNEVYVAKEGDECFMCNEQIVSCKSFVYSCSSSCAGSTSSNSSNIVNDECVKFLLHKSCAELPQIIENPSNKKQSLFLKRLRHLFFLLDADDRFCNICGIICTWFAYCSDQSEFFVCLQCAVFQLQSLEDRKFNHPAHSQHTLSLVQHPSSFKCHACKMESGIKELSYICTKCPFWIHKSCADAPTSFTFSCHDKHPLILSFSLPQVYRKFDQHCRLCAKRLSSSLWLYYCPKCRFFAHFHCARSCQMMSSREDDIYLDLLHLPAAEESSATNVIIEQFVKAMSTLNHNNIYIFEETKSIKHWADCIHHLQLITYNELNIQRDGDNDITLLCDCCVKPIRTDDSQVYGCVICNFFLHRDCAYLPNEINHPCWPGSTVTPGKCTSPFEFFYCYGCQDPGNGIYFQVAGGSRLHIGCALLPKKIKHEAHLHQLDRVNTVDSSHSCKACGLRNKPILYRCETCDVYLCSICVVMERTAKHRWDPHPLSLIYEAEMVADHEHEFDCEFCSQEIDPNRWFYHCSDCDLSFHPKCLGESCYLEYSNIKFGTPYDRYSFHPHVLTFILNKKLRRRCEKCHTEKLGKPILECAPCKIMFCTRCSAEHLQEHFRKFFI